MSPLEQHVNAVIAQFPLPAGADGAPIRFAYGTAGFRTTGAHIAPVAARVALLLVLRAHAQGGAPVGAMVTASHNPAKDNGLKLVDADGGMLAIAWEAHATALANTATAGDYLAALAAIEAAEGVSLAALDGAAARQRLVFVGRDTRATSAGIVAALTAGVGAYCAVADVGVVTTPALHWFVWWECQQRRKAAAAVDSADRAAFLAQPTQLSSYYDSYAASFAELMALAGGSVRRTVVVDCANGVGTIGLAALAAALERANGGEGPSAIAWEFQNTATDDAALLNLDCGADHTQKTKAPPAGFLPRAKQHAAERAAAGAAIRAAHASFYSVDGDADRIVAFDMFTDATQSAPAERATLLDGDRIIAIMAITVQQLLDSVSFFEAAKAKGDATYVKAFAAEPGLGVVQTAYANGGSTAYMHACLEAKLLCAATGVKHVHPVAAAEDIGIYFEANGHGTMLFNDGAHSGGGGGGGAKPFLHALEEFSAKWGAECAAARQLVLLSRVLSQCCGDAMADILALEACLAINGWTFAEWRDVYADLPSLQLKVTVGDPQLITNTADQTKALTPAGMQPAIDAAVAACGAKLARAFVRPSGTEPVVRVYAESADEAATVALAQAVHDIVVKFVP
jgi:phosphoacetylglucosamine mutase